MRGRVRLISGRADLTSVARIPRPQRRKKGSGVSKQQARRHCVCGRSFKVGPKGPLPRHKDRKTSDWCRGEHARRASPEEVAQSEPIGYGPSGPGRIRCRSCLKWFAAPDGALPTHRHPLGRRQCPGSPDADHEVGSKMSERKASSPRTARGGRPTPPKRQRADARKSLTPEQRRERAAKRKIDDRIELQMAELEERPPREDIEFGPGRDPRVYGGLSETRRSRY